MTNTQANEMYERGIIEGCRRAADAVSAYRDELLDELRPANRVTGNAMANIANEWLSKARQRARAAGGRGV